MNRFNTMALIHLVLLALALAGCAPKSHTPPAVKQNKQKLSATVNKSYDITWETLFRYAGSSFFTIERFDKSSGLMILSFGSSNAHEYIDCGNINDRSVERKYAGPYTSYLEQFAGAKLQGSMSIAVTEISPKKTSIRVNGKYKFATKLTRPTLLTFDSGSSATISVLKEDTKTGDLDTQTCHSTYKAENKIMQVIASLK
ncbi:hypothetical protein MMIC_P2450 [Mariprofundus micogutta]|uniref:Lipoprotein n=1 Tax=Mariprofundus micogutta TaxID=1921010 RepID=A0A1L8CRB0_9PROT|nr:hypothetical protein [Mariprofundus micogutta]GAV21461.1 hypothetical protein MMIC_P2450 [Mariprofundus micogutta]